MPADSARSELVSAKIPASSLAYFFFKINDQPY